MPKRYAVTFEISILDKIVLIEIETIARNKKQLKSVAIEAIKNEIKIRNKGSKCLGRANDKTVL